MTETTPAERHELEHKEIAFVRFAPWKTEHGTQKLTVTSGRTVYPMNYSTAIAIHAYVESQRRPLLNTADPHHTPATEDEREVDPQIKAIADAWLTHQGYRLDEIKDPDHSLCEMVAGVGWDCTDEEGVDRHPEYTALYQASEMANVALEALDQAGYRLHPTPNVDDVARRLSAIREAMSGTKNFKCGVCSGHSPQWDGHITGCQGWGLEELGRLIDQLKPESSR